jgi:hypothetical protein
MRAVVRQVNFYEGLGMDFNIKILKNIRNFYQIKTIFMIFS